MSKENKRLPKKFDKLTAENFKIVKVADGAYYHSFKFGIDGIKEYEITIEPCASGACVAAYDENNDLLFEKTCSNLKVGKLKKGQTAGERIADMSIEAAKFCMEKANDLYSKIYK